MKSPIIVHKYGGTSVGSSERILNVAKRLKRLSDAGHALVVVVSAMSGTTNRLIELASEVSAHPDHREYDALVSTGENMSAALLAMALIDMGCPARSLNGHQAGIVTSNAHSKAKIETITPDRILRELDSGRIAIVTGFQGVTQEFDVTTIGRGGSDTSAVALSAALNAAECHICTDVDGVYTTDPRIETKAQKINEISYDEMLELASLGAKVLHPRSVECAKEHQIKLVVRSSFTDDPGTLVKEISKMEATKPVTGLTVDKNQARLAIVKVADQPGTAATVFSRLAKANVNVDMIIQSVQNDGNNSIAFTVNKADINEAQGVLNELLPELHADKVTVDEDIAKLSIVGVGMISKPGVAAKMFETLAELNINVKHISTSEIKISCVIDLADADRAVNGLHDAFKLDQ